MSSIYNPTTSSVTQLTTAVQATISGTTYTIDWSAGNYYILTLSNATSCAISFTNPSSNGGKYKIQFIQDATGGRTFSLPTIQYIGGSSSAWSTAANKKDFLDLTYDPGNTTYYGVQSLNFS